MSAEALAKWVDEHTSCICFFGGDPAPQMPHALKTAKIALEKKENKILRVCWETNGSMCRPVLKKAADISLESGGCIKFDLKAFDPVLHEVLCGVPNYNTLKNFEFLAEMVERRKEPPFLIASTLLVPGYVDENEVKNIAEFIASLNPSIPYSLLAFHPDFEMNDLPCTSKEHAERCYKIAKRVGLERVNIGNVFTLGPRYGE